MCEKGHKNFEKGPLSLSVPPLSLCVFLYPSCLSVSLSQSYLTLPLSLFLCQILLEHLSRPLSLSLAYLPGPGLTRSGEKKKRMQLCLLTCLIMCQISLRVLVQTELGDSCPHVCVCLSLYGTIWTFARFSCWELQFCSRLWLYTHRGS